MVARTKTKIIEVWKDKTFKSLFIRLFIFLGIYTLINFFHGDLTESLLNFRLTTQDSFYLYYLYPMLGLFLYLKKGKIKELGFYKNNLAQTIIFGILGIGILFIPMRPLLTLVKDTPSLAGLIYYTQLCFAEVCLFTSIFNFKFIRKFKLDLGIILLFVFGYMGSQYLIQIYWQHFSRVILFLMTLILPYISKAIVFDINNYQIGLNEFNVFVGPPCSGIFSMVMFSLLFLYAVMFIKQNNKLHLSKTLLALAAGLIAVFLLNVVRISIIILIGGYYSAELAIDLFHEYLSAIFLIGLFVFYLYKVMPRIIKSPNQK